MNSATKGIQYDPSFNKKGTEMTRTARQEAWAIGVNVPDEYADWTEVDSEPKETGDVYIEVGGVRHVRQQGSYTMNATPVTKPKYFMPPKPVLPDVKPGAVIGYTDTRGRTCRAIKLEGMCKDPWRVFTNSDDEIESVDLNDHELLNDVNGDGFTIELEGL